MGWIGCVRCKKFRSDFVTRTFAQVWPVLPLVFKGNQTVPNAPKFKTHQNMSLGSNGVDRVRSLWKVTTRLRGTNFRTSSAHFPSTFASQPDSPNCTKIVWNAQKYEFWVQWGGSGTFVAKNSETTSWHELLHQFDPFCTEYWKATKQSQNAPK